MAQQMIYDYEKQEFTLDSKHLIEGIVDIDSNGIYKIGKFTPNPTRNVIITPCYYNYATIFYHCISDEIALKSNYTEIMYNDRLIFINKNRLISRNENGVYRSIKLRNKELMKYEPSRWIYSIDRNYNASQLIDEFSTIFNENFKNNIPKSSEYIKYLDYTYGLEFETCSGNLPERLCYKYGLIPLKDGSIKGHEYATIPYNKDTISILKDAVKDLFTYTDFDSDCSLHLHIGIPNLSKKLIYTYYKLACMVEDEFGKLFHKYIFDTRYYKSHGKSYCNRIVKHINSFEELYYYYSNEQRKYQGSVKTLYSPHPLNRDNNRKWEMTTRYTWLNILPLMFGKNKTMEFRLHTPTFNISKIQDWIFLCNSFVKFGELYQTEILNDKLPEITLKDLINVYPNDNLKEHLNTYINYREQMVIKNEKCGDKCGFIEVENDSDYELINNEIII